MLKTKTILYTGFFAILLLMAVFTSVGIGVLHQSVNRLDAVVNINNAKSELLHRMRTLARERNINIQKMMRETSEQELEKLRTEMERYGGEFAAARETLISMELSAKERHQLDQQKSLTELIAPLQHRIVDLVMFDERREARRLLAEQALPLQDGVFDALSELLNIQKQTADMALAHARQDYYRAMVIMLIVAIVLFVISISIILFIIRRITRGEDQLRYHRDNLELQVMERTEALQEAVQVAEHANLTKSEFVSTVSHELRTPLTSIRASLGLIKGGAVGVIPSGISGMLAIAESNADRLMYLINDLLDMQKIESGHMNFTYTTTPLLPLIQRSMANKQANAEQKRIRLKLFSAPANFSEVYVDPDRLLQVLDNMLSNAIKFSPSNDTVSITVAPRGELLSVTVADHGPGIPSEFQAMVFEKFTQADSSDTRLHGGTGLGMSISRSIMQTMHGSIDFETSAAGTSFCIEIPTAMQSRS